MGVWFTSDHHLGHRAMAWMRKYGQWPEDRSLVTPELVAEHDQMLAERWDAVVRKNDVVWVLGDLTANSRHVPEALSWVEQRPGLKHLILGNHDPAHPMHKDAHRWQQRYFQAFNSVQMAAERTIPLSGQRHQLVLLSHFPYTGDGMDKEDRCSQWRLREGSTATTFGLPVLHGHTHSSERVTRSSWGSSLQIHIGVDAWDYAPVSLEQIGELLALPQADC